MAYSDLTDAYKSGAEMIARTGALKGGGYAALGAGLGGGMKTFMELRQDNINRGDVFQHDKDMLIEREKLARAEEKRKRDEKYAENEATIRAMASALGKDIQFARPPGFNNKGFMSGDGGEGFAPVPQAVLQGDASREAAASLRGGSAMGGLMRAGQGGGGGQAAMMIPRGADPQSMLAAWGMADTNKRQDLQEGRAVAQEGRAVAQEGRDVVSHGLSMDAARQGITAGAQGIAKTERELAYEAAELKTLQAEIQQGVYDELLKAVPGGQHLKDAAPHLPLAVLKSTLDRFKSVVEERRATERQGFDRAANERAGRMETRTVEGIATEKDRYKTELTAARDAVVRKAEADKLTDQREDIKAKRAQWFGQYKSMLDALIAAQSNAALAEIGQTTFAVSDLARTIDTFMPGYQQATGDTELPASWAKIREGITAQVGQKSAEPPSRPGFWSGLFGGNAPPSSNIPAGTPQSAAAAAALRGNGPTEDASLTEAPAPYVEPPAPPQSSAPSVAPVTQPDSAPPPVGPSRPGGAAGAMAAALRTPSPAPRQVDIPGLTGIKIPSFGRGAPAAPTGAPAAPTAAPAPTAPAPAPADLESKLPPIDDIDWDATIAVPGGAAAADAYVAALEALSLAPTPANAAVAEAAAKKLVLINRQTK